MFVEFIFLRADLVAERTDGAILWYNVSKGGGMIQLNHYLTMAKMRGVKAEDTVVFLCGVSYENLGLILRSAAAFGAKSVLYLGSPPEKTEKLRKLSRSAAVATEYVEHAAERLLSLKSEGYMLAALELTDTAEPVCKMPPHGKLCLIVGGERHGVPQELLDLCDKAYCIEMVQGSVSSLNVATATAIALSRRLELGRYSPPGDLQ